VHLQGPLFGVVVEVELVELPDGVVELVELVLDVLGGQRQLFGSGVV
jgi:hypothetical protein